MKIYEKCLSIVLIFLVNHSIAQLSVGFNAGFASNADTKADAYALDVTWPTPTTGGGAVVFYKGGTGFSKCVFVTY